MPTKEEELKQAKDLASTFLKARIKKGATVYGQFISVNGAHRIYVFYVVVKGELVKITGEIANVIGYRMSKSVNRADGIDVGSGDDGTHIVQNLSHALFGSDSALTYRHFL